MWVFTVAVNVAKENAPPKGCIQHELEASAKAEGELKIVGMKNAPRGYQWNREAWIELFQCREKI